VQELLEGETLRAELAGGRFSPRKAIDYAIQIAQGLSAAHDKGIVHRDLKPENLFVTKEGRVKILDFGLAKLTQAEGAGAATNVPTATEPGVVMGTLGYMSPEQVKARPADGRSDIFALGVILYEMLSGGRPFRGDSAGETMAAILKEDPPDLSATNATVSPGLERLVRHCLEKNPERRFQSASDLAYDLETLTGISGATVAARAQAARSRSWRRALTAAALLVLGAVAGWAASTILRSKPSTPSYTRLTFRRGTVGTARFAPDGQTVVYSATWDGEPYRLFVTRAGSRESGSLQLPDAKLLAVSSSGELAIAIGRMTAWLGTGVLARVPIEGGSPREVLENVSGADWSPDGRELAVVHVVGGRNRIEFPIGKVLFESVTIIDPLRFSPSGDRLAFSLGNSRIVTVDRSGKVQTLSSGWRDMWGLAWRPDGREIWFSAEGSDGKFALHAVTLSGRERLLRREAAGLLICDLSRDGRALLGDYLYRQGIVLRTAGETSERELSWMDFSSVRAISSDGETVLFDETGEGGGAKGGVYLRAVNGPGAVRLGDGVCYAISPDSRWILSGPYGVSNAITLLPKGPGQPRTLTVSGVDDVFSGCFLPDGKRVALIVRVGNSKRVCTQDLDGGEPRSISSVATAADGIAVSPDGRFVAVQGADSKIVTCPVDGGPAHAVAGVQNEEDPLLWSADGTLYVYKSGESIARVFKVDMATGRRELWKAIAPADRSGVNSVRVVISPDARSYAYGYDRALTSLELAEGLQ